MSTMASQITCVSHRSPVDSPHKGQWRGALMFSLIWAWANSREAGDLRHHRAHYDVTVMNDLYSGTGNSLQPVWLQEITSITAASLSSWPLEQTSVKFQSMYSFLWFKFHDTVFPDIYIMGMPISEKTVLILIWGPGAWSLPDHIPMFQQYCMQYHVMLDHIITTPDCI